ncbi:MAG TPA: hypothetical protein VKY89_11895 [Thermoanaerobaculia bacterium]|jgi:hypothetical protein|nr:hypothetical protein [Thermoanaerobaculia bacterium]
MRTRSMLCLLAAAALLAVPALAGSAPAASPTAAASPAFDHLKALSGTWTGKAGDGKTTRATYEVSSGGSAVVEKFQTDGEPPMVTVYYPDGSQVMLTHYCTLANQPRLRTTQAGSGNQLEFDFVDATNMKSPADAHMDKVRFTFADTDHFVQEWTMKHDGKEMPLVIHFERTK